MFYQVSIMYSTPIGDDYMVRKDSFDSTVALPPGLTIEAIKRAIKYLEKQLIDFVEIYYDQANMFSGVVSIIGTKALDSVSNYEKHRHADTAQQRFPDLHRRGYGTNLTPQDSLESKASKRPWAIQSHYDHPGWYIIWRYLVDATKTIESGKSVIIWRVDVVYLDKTDWKYEGSTASATGGGRTHTFSVKTPATKLKGKAVYSRKDIILTAGKPVLLDITSE
jgi:hypothetical protein